MKTLVTRTPVVSVVPAASWVPDRVRHVLLGDQYAPRGGTRECPVGLALVAPAGVIAAVEEVAG